MVDSNGKPAPDVRASFAGPVVAAREVNAQEQPVGSAEIKDGSLATSFTAYQPRTFALKLGAATAHITAPQSQPVKLKYDLAAASNDDTKTAGGGMDGKGNALPAEMLPHSSTTTALISNSPPPQPALRTRSSPRGRRLLCRPGRSIVSSSSPLRWMGIRTRNSKLAARAPT